MGASVVDLMTNTKLLFLVPLCLLVGAMAQEPKPTPPKPTLQISLPNWNTSRMVQTPLVELRPDCRCMIIHAATGALVGTLYENKRESAVVEALATALMVTVANRPLKDWREYLPNLEVKK